MELNYKLLICQVVIFSVTQINESSCHSLEDENNNYRKGGGKHKKGRREKQVREGRKRTSYALPLPKTSLKALQQGEIQSLFNLDLTKIIKGKK